MELPEVECRDEVSTSSEPMDLIEEGNNGTIEFIKVEHDEETQYVDEFDLEESEMEDGNKSIEETETAMTKEAFILSFINAVRQMPILWKQNRHGYRNPKAVLAAWDTLSVKFGIAPEHLRTKWTLLRSQFRSNRAKMRQSTNKNYQPPWFAFDAMSFLEESRDETETETTAEAILTPVEDDDGCAESDPTYADEVDTQSVVLELIKQIKHTPLLWDQSCLLYNNKTKQLAAWKKIAERMNFSVGELKMKWQRLRAQLRNVLNKMKAQSSAGLPVNRPTWFGFDAMLFVLKNMHVDGIGLDLTEDIKQSLSITPTQTKPGLKAVLVKHAMPKTVDVKHLVPTLAAVKPPMSTPIPINQPLSKPITIKRFVPRAAPLSPAVKPNIRDYKRRYIGATINTPPKLLRLTSHSSSPDTPNPAPLVLPSSTTSTKVDPFIIKTFQNLTTITDRIAQTEASPYSGLLNHLSVVLSRKRASDFNQIEGLLLNCLNELHKFPNATKDTTVRSPSTIVIDDRDQKDDEREDSNDSDA